MYGDNFNCGVVMKLIITYSYVSRRSVPDADLLQKSGRTDDVHTFRQLFLPTSYLHSTVVHFLHVQIKWHRLIIGQQTQKQRQTQQ